MTYQIAYNPALNNALSGASIALLAVALLQIGRD